jgi:hypothetical protein
VGERVTSCLERVDKWQVQATYYLCKRRCVKNLVTASLYHQDRLDFSTIDHGHFVPPLADSGSTNEGNNAQFQACIDHPCFAAQPFESKEAKSKRKRCTQVRTRSL